uniref:Uncharacterized protein n=1 Tax=Callorhinchus milii TaxID=7868 RepID=A0A4W3J9P2_CALMI
MGGKEWEERERGRERERERERERGRLKTREVLSAAGVSRAVVFVRDLREGTLGEKLRECGQADPTVLRRGAAGGLAVRITGEGDCLLLTASAAEFCAAAALQPPAIIPLHRLICFCRYFLWLTFLLDLPGLSSASLMLLEAESMKLSRALVVCLPSPGLPAIAAASSSSSPPTLPISYSTAEPGKQKWMKWGFMIAACTAIASPRGATRRSFLHPREKRGEISPKHKNNNARGCVNRASTLAL